MDKKQVEISKVVKEMCRETVLCLGGIFAVHEVADDVVWQTAKSLDIIFQNAIAKVSSQGVSIEDKIPERRFKPHPAIQEILENLDQD